MDEIPSGILHDGAILRAFKHKTMKKPTAGSLAINRAKEGIKLCRPIFDLFFYDKPLAVAVFVGSNGFVVEGGGSMSERGRNVFCCSTGSSSKNSKSLSISLVKTVLKIYKLLVRPHNFFLFLAFRRPRNVIIVHTRGKKICVFFFPHYSRLNISRPKVSDKTFHFRKPLHSGRLHRLHHRRFSLRFQSPRHNLSVDERFKIVPWSWFDFTDGSLNLLPVDDHPQRLSFMKIDHLLRRRSTIETRGRQRWPEKTRSSKNLTYLRRRCRKWDERADGGGRGRRWSRGDDTNESGFVKQIQEWDANSHMNKSMELLRGRLIFALI